MIPFQVAEALRRVRRRHAPGRPRSSVPTWRLVGGEASHLARVALTAPAVAVVAAGLTAAFGVHVALGPAYPGPVAPDLARWGLLALVVGASGALARLAPRRWSEVRGAVRRARLVLAVPLLAALTALVKVGLHEMTPGPVLPAGWRWALVALAGVAAVVLVGAGGGPRDRPR